jgi:hypothetical protein
MTLPPASVLILTYNTRELVLRCLESFCAEVLRDGWQVIVVDNGSTDGTAPAIAERFPDVEVVRSEENLGYAAGNNRGLQRAIGHCVILLNSDVIASPSALRALCRYLEAHPRVGAVSAGLRAADGRPQAFAYGGDPTPVYLLRRGLHRLLGKGPLHSWDVSEPIEVDWVSGACLAVRHAVIEQVGFLDERFFLYFEDNDWCLRMRQAGWRVVYDPSVTVTHLGGASEPQRFAANRIYYDSMVAFYRKHYGPLCSLVLRLPLTVYITLLSKKEGGG